jgi:hypothetical protein
MLKLYALPQLSPQTILQEDGAPPNFCHHVRNHVDREIAVRRIDRSGIIGRHPTSPDLTPLDFFLWGYVKNIVCQVKNNDLQHLKVRIRNAVAEVTPNMLQGTRNVFLFWISFIRTPCNIFRLISVTLFYSTKHILLLEEVCAVSPVLELQKRTLVLGTSETVQILKVGDLI